MTDEQKDAVVGMFAAGCSMRIIAKHFNTTHKKISVLLKERGIESSYRKQLPAPAIIEMYSAGESMNAIAKKYKVAIGTIKRVLINNKIKLRSNSLNVDEAQVLQMYAEPFSSSYKIADELGISQFSVLKILRSHGAVKTVAEAQRKNFFNEQVFEKIDSETKAYWLGFMFGDGYVKSNLKEFGITLATGDRGHLEKFAAFLEYTGEIYTYDATPGSFSNNSYSRITPCSRITCTDLISHGCVPRKTHVLEAPVGLNKNLFKHFIRGLTDADGGLYIYPKSVSWELVGDHGLLEWVIEQLPVEAKLEKHKSIWRVRRAGSNAAKIITWLYESSSVSLDRKMSRAEEVMRMYK